MPGYIFGVGETAGVEVGGLFRFVTSPTICEYEASQRPDI